MMPAGNRSSLRLPAGIFVSALVLALSALASPALSADDMNATISGRATFQGPPPPRPMQRMTVDRACDAAYPKGRPAESVVVDPSGGLANVLVHVVAGLPKKYVAPAPAAEARIDLKGCGYAPHVIGLRVGQEVAVRNHDATLHVVHARAGENPPFTASLPGEGSEIRKVLARPGLGVKLKCDRHPWEVAWLAAFEHPFFAVTAADGSFAIPGLPEGEYTVEAWHEVLGTQRAKLEVDEGGHATANFPFAGN